MAEADKDPLLASNTRDDKVASGTTDKAAADDVNHISRRKLLLGVPIVVGIALTWVGSTQTAKSTFTATFNGPFFNVWFSTCFMLLCFPVYLLVKCQTSRLTTCSTEIRSACTVLESYTLAGSRQVVAQRDESLRHRLLFIGVQSLTVVGPFCVLWVATNYCYLRALASIAPTDVTALFSSAPAFVYIFSRLFLKEPFVFLRPLAVALAICGIVLFAYADGFGAASTRGIALSVASAVGAGLYKTLFKLAVGDATLGQVSLFLSILALLNLTLLWPVAVGLGMSGVEQLHDYPWTFLLPNAFLGMLFNFLINFGIAFTYPLFISLGTVLGIPINAVADYVFRGVTITPLKITSTAYILSAFFFMLASPAASKLVSQGLQAILCCGLKRTEYDLN